MFILAAVLSRHRRGIEQWVLCVAGVSNLLVVNRYLSYFYDLRYTWQSVLFLVFAVSLIFAYWPREKKKVTEPGKLPVKSTEETSGAAHPSDQPAA
jgi:membrane protein implicated in regulation of membrane protease activity